MYNRLDREALELHLLTSLARSQRALCRIIESVADQVVASQQITEEMAQNLKLISSYQRVLVQKITRLKPLKKKSTTPSPPWLASEISLQTSQLEIGR